MTVTPATTWVDVCGIDDLVPGRGVAAMVHDRQVAIFLVPGGELAAVDNVDPCSGAAVLSRGIVGSSGEIVHVASPVHKQRFDLHTGACLDADASIAVWAVRVVDGRIEVAEPC